MYDPHLYHRTLCLLLVLFGLFAPTYSNDSLTSVFPSSSVISLPDPFHHHKSDGCPSRLYELLNNNVHFFFEHTFAPQSPGSLKLTQKSEAANAPALY